MPPSLEFTGPQRRFIRKYVAQYMDARSSSTRDLSRFLYEFHLEWNINFPVVPNLIMRWILPVRARRKDWRPSHQERDIIEVFTIETWRVRLPAT